VAAGVTEVAAAATLEAAVTLPDFMVALPVTDSRTQDEVSLRGIMVAVGPIMGTVCTTGITVHTSTHPYNYGLDDYNGYAYPYYDNDDSFDVQPAPNDIAPQESTAPTMAVQRKLTQLGYYHGAIDGIA
jgi:hypothetical protein